MYLLPVVVIAIATGVINAKFLELINLNFFSMPESEAFLFWKSALKMTSTSKKPFIHLPRTF